MAKTTAKRTTKARPATPKKSTRRPAATRRAKKGPSKFSMFFLPVFVSMCILFCLGFLGLMGYRTVTASNFFNVTGVEVQGTSRSSRDDIKRIVTIQTERSGVWNADLPVIREKIEKLAFVKTAAVTRVLPNGVSVHISERQPQAIVRLKGGSFLVDAEGRVIAPAVKPEPDLPIALLGWDEEKSERADKDNIQRVQIYQKMVAEWREFELAKRVREIDLSDLRTPRATIEESGKPIAVSLARENFGKSLRTALEAVAGKGDRVKSVDAGGVYPVLEYISF